MSISQPASAMPRYHFNTHNGHANMDKEGVVLSDLSAARRRAIRLSATVIESDLAEVHLGEDWRMDVTDDQGRLRLQLHFTVLKFRQPADLVEHQGVAT